MAISIFEEMMIGKFCAINDFLVSKNLKICLALNYVNIPPQKNTRHGFIVVLTPYGQLNTYANSKEFSNIVTLF